MIRNLKLLSGLIIFLFITLHLSNLAVGIFSLQAADELRPVLMAPFTNLIGGYLLIGSILLHAALGLLSLYQRNTLRMTRYDAAQFLSALMIPPLLIPHAWGVIALQQFLDYNPTYLDIFRTLWIDDPVSGLRQVLLVVVVWIHGCIGLFTWLRLYAWWPRAALFAYPLAVAIPVMALLGFVAGGNHILAHDKQLAAESNAYGDSETAYPSQYNSSRYEVEPQQPSDPYNGDAGVSEAAETLAFISRVKWQIIAGYLMLIFLVLLARYIRVRSQSDELEVHYADGRVVTSMVGPSLLDLSNMSDIPHASLCRGRGRCGTCRVEIIYSDRALPEPGSIERATLGLEDTDSSIRLACQLSPPAGVIKIRRLLPPNITQPVRFSNTEWPDTVADAESLQQDPQKTTA